MVHSGQRRLHTDDGSTDSDSGIVRTVVRLNMWPILILALLCSLLGVMQRRNRNARVMFALMLAIASNCFVMFYECKLRRFSERWLFADKAIAISFLSDVLNY